VPPRGIGFYLIALILLAVVPLLVISGLLIWRHSELQRTAFEKSLLQTALALTVAVDRQLDSYRVMLETLAASEALAQRDMAGFHAFSARVAATHGAVFVSFFDRDGRQVFNTLRPSGEALPTPFKDPRVQLGDAARPPVGDPTYLKLAFATGRPNVSNLTYGLVAQRLIFVVNVPVVREGKVEYVLNAAFEPDVMTRLLKENPTFSGVPAVIYDRNGFIVGRWQAAEQHVGKRVLNHESTKDESSGVSVGQTLEGMKVYFSFARSPLTGWGVNVGAERDEVEGAIGTIRTVGVVLAIGGLLLGVLFALVIATRLRNSIARLADKAGGAAPAAGPGLRTREIAQLELALDEAAAVREEQARERESRLVAETRKSEAEEANRAKDRFIALLSHELRNPLAPIRTSVYLLRGMQDKPSPPLRDVVDMLDRQSEQLTRLVNDLLDASRISVGKMSLQKRPIDLRDVVRHAVETAKPRIDARGHRLAQALPPAPVLVDGDFARLSQVLSNLLDNAAKFTADGGHIEIRVSTEQQRAVLRVKDGGRGMDAALLCEVFKPFTQSEQQELHRGLSGLGLGLSIAKTLAELHGGSLEAASAGANRGSEFILRLPLAGAAAPSAPEAGAVAKPLHCRVLVVDDNEDAAATMSALLIAMGCESRAVYDGASALEVAASWRPDAILLDIGLPGMDGYEVARRMRQSGARPWPLLVALTGWGQDADRERSRAAGFDLHLVKPVGVDELRMALFSASRGSG
jgi:signal transduction histidine kinase/CheY-like chemotaxis protein